MGRIYPVIFENVSISAAQDLWDIAPADDKPVVLHAINLSNVGGTADAGDAQEELLRLRIQSGLATVGSGGTAVSAADPHQTGVNWSFTARTNDTTIAVVGGGSTIGVFADGWNVRVPYEKVWTPETRPPCSQGNTRVVVTLVAAPADAISVSGTLYVEELG